MSDADDDLRVVFVSADEQRRAAVQRVFPEVAALSVVAVPDAAAALDALSETDADCVAVEHARRPAEAVGEDADGSDGDDAVTANGGAVRATDTGSARSGRADAVVDPDATDGLRVLRLVRDTDPAVPVVVFEAAEGAPIASDAISLDVTEYVRETGHDEPLAVLARTCRDAARTYRSERDVAMLNDLARNVYERVTDGFFALDRDWRFTYLNEAAEEILEVDADDVVGENVWDAFPGAVGTDFYTEYHRAMAAQEPVTFREHYPPLERTFEVRAFPSEDGLSVHFREVIDDEDAARGDHFLELTDLLSSDLLESIEALERDLEAARDAADDTDHFDDALAGVERMRSLVDYSIRLASEPPEPDRQYRD